MQKEKEVFSQNDDIISTMFLDGADVFLRAIKQKILLKIHHFHQFGEWVQPYRTAAFAAQTHDDIISTMFLDGADVLLR